MADTHSLWGVLAFFGAVTLSAYAPVAAEAPSFDCALAESSAEKLVCSNSDLAELDQKLAGTYAKAVSALGQAADATQALNRLKATQRGWVKGRDECWKASDEQACIKEAYERRIGMLTARYMLIPDVEPVFYTCNGNPADEIVASFYPSTPASVRLERGDTVEAAVQAVSGSGARYLGNFGLVFWVKGDEAMVTWPQEAEFTCEVRK
ncbi:uncharacterized protein JM93_01242 [Roseibium hamelinense]|uniref:Membrane-bound lysozyme inhibitor of c-type lysozyme MliC n=1 Tax=Roseibium hamelinense TaxID=150831 RepID=A0A562TAA0_9HYPH|nr:MliC family protein [Roseibium hamelinense]MTI45367.1 DUF1311 domain-containing protein [Roseibium hamelinense]TWI90263.1 uncharacterized protein JM93_01242 [Roseibium hamelinense]